MKQGVVVSDLHMFARRSNAHILMSQIKSVLSKSDMLVLNGDTFDFRWSTLPSIDETIKEAVDWIDGLARSYPECQVRVVCGNHDCRADYLFALEELTNQNSSVTWHEHFTHVDNLLFLHGDCDSRHTRLDKIAHWSEPYPTSKKVTHALGLMYDKVNQTGLTSLAQRLANPPKRVTKKVYGYISEVAPEVMDKVQHVYFGHSHVPFSYYEYNGLFFHNTGCAVHSAEFNPIHFLYEE